jgi:hypothetical protein
MGLLANNTAHSSGYHWGDAAGEVCRHAGTRFLRQMSAEAAGGGKQQSLCAARLTPGFYFGGLLTYAADNVTLTYTIQRNVFDPRRLDDASKPAKFIVNNTKVWLAGTSMSAYGAVREAWRCAGVALPSLQSQAPHVHDPYATLRWLCRRPLLGGRRGVVRRHHGRADSRRSQ